MYQTLSLRKQGIISPVQINVVGLISALVTFLGIAFGHIAVRWIEFRIAHLWIPALLFLLGGIAMETKSFASTNLPSKIILGILGFIFLWDAVELFRQERRVRRGHAPANPQNPRHRRFLENPSSAASTIDLLRDEIHPILNSRFKS